MIRIATEADLLAIVAIYNAAVPGRMATADTDAVTVESRREWFAAHDLSRHPLWVDERDGEVAGWLSLGVFYNRPAWDITAEVSVYVAPAYQRQGVASALLEAAIAAAPRWGCVRSSASSSVTTSRVSPSSGAVGSRNGASCRASRSWTKWSATLCSWAVAWVGVSVACPYAAGYPHGAGVASRPLWIPAFAGMTDTGLQDPAFAGITVRELE